MKTSRFLLSLVLLALSALPASAASSPWITSLVAGGIVTVPAGKVLIIEQAANPAAAATTAKFAITGTTPGIGLGAFVADLNFAIPANGIHKLPAPLRLGAGMTLRNAGTATLTLTGIALDAQDFSFKSLLP